MKRSLLQALCLLLCLLLVCSLGGCGKKRAEPEPEGLPADAAGDEVVEVKITMANLYDYFEYKEYPSVFRGETTGEISNVQVAYGMALREGWTAANDPKYKDTLRITYTAEQVIHSGRFTVDFDTLRWEGTPTVTERRAVSEELVFWKFTYNFAMLDEESFSDAAGHTKISLFGFAWSVNYTTHYGNLNIKV